METWRNIKDRLEEGCMRFDISGFGFQFPRELLFVMAEVISELYPCDQIDICIKDLQYILDNVSVEYNYRVVKPPRGIGLGYYEDLKTLAMLAILQEHEPISVYGDQGILKPGSFMAIIDLQRFNFILRDDKVEYQSYDRNGGMKWAGSGFFPNGLKRVKDISNPLLGSFFSRFHWERKMNLVSLYNENPIFYKNNYKKIKNAYTMFFGYEFFPDDLDLPFQEGGINPNGRITIGTSKSFIISKYLMPYNDSLFETPYVTPFKKRQGKIYPTGVAKEFQRKRIEAYKNFKPISSEVFFYSNPRIEYNGTYVPKNRLLPDWADMLFLCEYGASTGNFSFGLDQEKLLDIAYQWYLSPDPLRAAARGGYKLLDPVYSRARPLGREWVVALEFLQKLDSRLLPYMTRVDLGLPSMLFAEDELYRNVSLLEDVSRNELKRKRSHSTYLERDVMPVLKSRLLESITSKVHSGIIDGLNTLISDVDLQLEQIGEQDYAADYEDYDLYDDNLNEEIE